ncbi:hypothetical protein M404DRAFT_72282, partial [Pisolithus tinctorius Marx 270]
INSNSIFLPLTLQTLDDRWSFNVEVLLDSGASGCYIGEGYVRTKLINTQSLLRAVPVYNADGSSNDAGPV